MKKLLALISLLTIGSSFAQVNRDLVLDGEKWLSSHSGYICKAFGTQVQAPSQYASMEVKFVKLSTDYTLDNALLTATFKSEESVCSYSALLFADNDASTIKLLESNAYALNGNSDCQKGRDLIDSHLSFNQYLYWGHPHHVTIMINESSAASICGNGASEIGIDFTLSGVIRN